MARPRKYKFLNDRYQNKAKKNIVTQFIWALNVKRQPKNWKKTMYRDNWVIFSCLKNNNTSQIQIPGALICLSTLFIYVKFQANLIMLLQLILIF